MEQEETTWLPVPITVSLVVLGWVMVRLFPAEGPEFSVQILGSPLGIRLTPAFWIGIFGALLAAAGTEALLRTHPRFPEESPWRLMGRWITPMGMAVGGLVFTRSLPTGPAWLLGLGLGGLGLALAMVGERYRMEVAGLRATLVRLAHPALGYLVALAAIGWGFQSGLRTLTLLGLGGGIAAALALARLAEAEVPERRRWLYGGLIGWSMGTVAAAFRYWTLPPVVLGLWWMLALYELTEMSLWHLQGRRLSARVAVEFGGLGLLIAWLARWLAAP